MKIECKLEDPPLGGVLSAGLYKSQSNAVEVVWGTDSQITLPGDGKKVHYRTSNDLIRVLERTFPKKNVSAQDRVMVNHWLTFSLSLEAELPSSLLYLEKTLSSLTFLVGEDLSVADLAVFAVLHVSNKFVEIAKENCPKNVQRWMKLIGAQPSVVTAFQELPKECLQNLKNLKQSRKPTKKAETTEASSGRQQEGKFVDLPGAEMGKVVVRFPPEASGYLHIGHAKAALLNQYYQQAFQGKLIMRFDDTNPAKENVHFEKVILEDVELLELRPDLFTHTSQYFDLMLSLCEKLIREGKAFVDDTPGEQMKSEREQKVESKNRNNSVEKNLLLWGEMQAGSETGVRCCVRAKMFMDSANGCMRDPTIYRCKPEPHPRTGTQYKVYPTYDFACPIVDSIEGVTHVLRTMEYHDRDDQFFWFIEALGLRRPYIWEYSRLSMTNTVLSKRKLTWFVESGLVDGWDDPRMPTVRGVLRRGMTVEGLRQFITAQGSSRSVVFMEWDKIWAINKKVIDPIAPRYTALEANPVPVKLKGVTESTLDVPLHPKNPEVGSKTVWVSPTLLIDQVDAQALKEGENTTFINYGNVLINKIHRSADGKVTSIDGTPNLANKDYKKTLKITWLADSPKSPVTEAYCVYFDHIISKPLLSKDEDFKQFVGHQTRWESAMLGEPALASVRQGDIVQLQRRGFFRVDVAPGPRSPHSHRTQPAVLFHIPDGHTKETPGITKPLQTSTAQTNASPAAAPPSGDSAASLYQLVTEQGDLVRSLKTGKADKAAVDSAVKQLLALKAKYKEATGQEYKPGAAPIAASPTAASQQAAAGGDGSSVAELLAKIAAQGDTVRRLKSEKADKAILEVEVKNLLSLKSEYKKATGSEWNPNAVAGAAPVSAPSVGGAAHLGTKIAAQGDKVRQLKESKADKATVQAGVKVLLELKAEYKKATGADWTPTTAATATATAATATATTTATAAATANGDDLSAKVAAQGDKVRTLKEQKADKATVQAEVQALLALKVEYKKATGKDWSPNMEVKTAPARAATATATATATAPATAAAAAVAAAAGDAGAELVARITSQGDLVRQLKTDKADKAKIDEAVKTLLELKAQYQEKTGAAYAAPSAAKPRDSKPKDSKPKEQSKPKEKKESKPKEQTKPPKGEPASGIKKVSRLGLEASKESDLSEWYSQVITKAEMIEYYDISGCYILRPWSFSIWEIIKNFLSAEFKKLGVKECYFPIFVSKTVLEREKNHIADFAPEVAWVTHSGSSELAEHIAVRPTSETVMYPAYAKWIQSHRDLPLKLNQWNNVVRWEFKQPQPFIRTREFLWQEGHTAFLTKEEADKEVLTILELYARVYEDLLAIPVVRGRKSEKEKFAGGDYTTTVEGYVPASGRGIQGATSHHLGQNFAKMFDIIYDDPETQEKKYVYQNSWGLTTRTIGVMVLVHGDNRGLVLPPHVASVQAIVVPCGIKAESSAQERAALLDSCKLLEQQLLQAGVRAEGDYRDNYSPGWKYNHWELKGVPLRIELGPKEMSRGEIVVVRRLDGQSVVIKRTDAAREIIALLDKTHHEMLNKATADRDACTTVTAQWAEFTAALDKKHVLLAPFCGEIPCEDNIKNDSAKVEEEAAGGGAMGAKSLCIPFKQPRDITPADKCVHPACKNKPKFYGLFGRSY